VLGRRRSLTMTPHSVAGREAQAARFGLDAGVITPEEALGRAEQLQQLLHGAAADVEAATVAVVPEVDGLRTAALGLCDCAGEGKWWLGEHRPADPQTGRIACPRWTPDPAVHPAARREQPPATAAAARQEG
jgi:hypothetical protein